MEQKSRKTSLRCGGMMYRIDKIAGVWYCLRVNPIAVMAKVFFVGDTGKASGG